MPMAESSPKQITPGAHRTHSLWRRKPCVFRLVAVGVPTFVGLVVVVGLLIYQGRLSFDPETGTIQFTDAPIYLEEPGHEITGHKYLYDKTLGWRNIPDWKWTSLGRKLTINSKGLRDRSYDYEKPPGVRRILVLGDSYAWGYGVADHEIFTEVLEARLEATPQHWQVINAGVSGWGTDQEYLFLKTEGFKYSPDIVVLSLYLINDPENNSCSMQYGLYKPLFINTNLDLVNVPVPKPGSELPVLRADADPLELTLKIIVKMAEVCAARGCKLVVMKFGVFLWPDIPVLRVAEQHVADKVGQFPATSYLDLDGGFERHGVSASQLLTGNNDDHWNAYGHEVTAEILHEFLADRGLLQRE
jgi:lysophospholipase L1-like esterase